MKARLWPSIWPARRRVPFVQQTTTGDCGAACLAMVLRLHGRRIPLDHVRSEVGPDRRGTNAERLLRVAEGFGLEARGVEVGEVRDLAHLGRGAILHYRSNHFVVLDRTDRSGIRVVDPAVGRARLTWDEVKAYFSGVALLFDPGEDFEVSRGGAGEGGRYRQLLRAHAVPIAGLLAISLAARLLVLALPLLVVLLVDRAIADGDRQLLRLLAVGATAGLAAAFLVFRARARAELAVGARLDSELVTSLLRRLADLPLSFFQQRTPGDLLARLHSAAGLREVVIGDVLAGLVDGVAVLVGLALLCWMNWWIGLTASFLGLLAVAARLAASADESHPALERGHGERPSHRRIAELVEGIEATRAMGLDADAVQDCASFYGQELDALMLRRSSRAAYDGLVAVLSPAIPLVVLLLAASQALAGRLSLGMVLAMGVLAVVGLPALATLPRAWRRLASLPRYLERIDDIFEAAVERSASSSSRGVELEGWVRLVEVSFSHAATGPVALRDVSVDIERGGFVAVFGGAGAGKSTFAGLLAGLHPPTAGKVEYDGRDLADLDLRSVRRQLGVVTQRPSLFRVSAETNISLARPGIDRPRVIEAAKLAGIHDDLTAMAWGYDTVLDEGARLSRAQRHQIALARALAGRPVILVLDQATDALDVETESRVLGSLTRLDWSCTRILLTGRPGSTRGADLVLVLAGGEVVERGEREALMTKPGRFREMIEMEAGRLPPRRA